LLFSSSPLPLQFQGQHAQKSALLFRYQVFISYLMEEAGKEAGRLKAALEARNVSSFVSHLDVGWGGNFVDTTAAAVVGCALFVVLGTETYGKETSVGLSGCHELKFALDEGKPLLLIKMFDGGQFKVPMTQQLLPRDVPSVRWGLHTDLRGELVDTICSSVPPVRRSGAAATSRARGLLGGTEQVGDDSVDAEGPPSEEHGPRFVEEDLPSARARSLSPFLCISLSFPLYFLSLFSILSSLLSLFSLSLSLSLSLSSLFSLSLSLSLSLTLSLSLSCLCALS
jgi:hypothetical protein